MDEIYIKTFASIDKEVFKKGKRSSEKQAAMERMSSIVEALNVVCAIKEIGIFDRNVIPIIEAKFAGNDDPQNYQIRMFCGNFRDILISSLLVEDAEECLKYMENLLLETD